MTMDFSQLHTYTPPQCAPENTGYTYSLSSSYSSVALAFEKEHQIAPVYDSPRMSRRSLRLQTSAGAYGTASEASSSQNHSSNSYTRRETRTLRSRKQQSTSSSQSLSLNQPDTPRRTLTFSVTSTPIDGSRAAADASLLSTSATDQSRVRHRSSTTTTITTTTVDGHWGSPSVHHSSSGVNGAVGDSASESHANAGVNGYICQDCSVHSPRQDDHHTQSSSSALSQAASASASALQSSSSSLPSQTSRIYSRYSGRREHAGVLTSVSNTCTRYGKRALAPIASLLTLLLSSVRWLGSKVRSQPGKGVLAFSSSWARQAVSSGLSQLWLLKHSTLLRLRGHRANGYKGQAHSSEHGSINEMRSASEDASHFNLNGSLCDDCRGKQCSATHFALVTHSSRSQRLAGALWSGLAYAGHCLRQPGYFMLRASRSAASGLWTVAERLVSLLWLLLIAPVRAGRGLLWSLATGWYQLVTFMSLINAVLLERYRGVSNLLKMLLALLLLLFLVLLLWSPSFWSMWPFLPAPIAVLKPEAPVVQTPVTVTSEATSTLPPVVVSSMDAERLERVEKQLALLWEQVQQGSQQQGKHHGELMALYSSLREQLQTQTDRNQLGVWVSSLLEQRIGVLRGELDQDNARTAEKDKQQRQEQQHSLATRLADLQGMLTILSAKTEEIQLKQQSYKKAQEEAEKQLATLKANPAPSPVSVGVKQEQHNALLTEVQRLEAELSKVKQDLQGVMGCAGRCNQLNTLQDTISAQVSLEVQKELRGLFFGSGQAGEVPESLLAWLSQRYTSTPDLQASLAALELSILKKVSQQVEQSRAQTLGEAETRAKAVVQSVTSTVQHVAYGEGLSEEQVKLIVHNALKLYSQDRTGLVDYALESGGGSILSTRCSETFETKTALMSLFGLPLWYFSQSPRVVIQPDVYPGNCWAFKGSQGYLVIRLSMKILPKSFCVEHLPRALSPTGNITSAPQNFTVFGLEDEYQEEGTMLGQYKYEEDGESLQSFPVMTDNDKAFQIIEVRVLSNWGHPDYTCLYRFRVHGEPVPQ